MENGRPVSIPQVKLPRESQLLENVYKNFPIYLKHDLITNEYTKFFVERTPRWKGIDYKYDKRGKRVNGVINVSKTIDSDMPVWNPVDEEAYGRYLHKGNIADRNLLSKQVLSLLYTVRNNLVHGEKSTDDLNSEQVLCNALPLLEMIVLTFIDEEIVARIH